MIKKFFVYGTLKSDGVFGESFEQYRIFCEPATVQGYKLYSLGAYPAMVEGNQIVYGEVHEYIDTYKMVEVIDGIEGVYQFPPLYNRVVDKAKINNKDEEVMLYIFNDLEYIKKYNIPKVEDGNWVNYQYKRER